MKAVLIVVAIVVVLAIIGFVVAASRRRKHDQMLHERFGPEYDRVMQNAERDRDARMELDLRMKQREQLQIRPLSEADRTMYLQEWTTTQSRFVDDPSGAVREADSLVMRVMRDRGYPVGDFDQRADLVSVDHPDVVGNYRAAHDIALRNDRGAATTDDLRDAVIRYRSLFAALIETGDAPSSR